MTRAEVILLSSDDDTAPLACLRDDRSKTIPTATEKEKEDAAKASWLWDDVDELGDLRSPRSTKRRRISAGRIGDIHEKDVEAKVGKEGVKGSLAAKTLLESEDWLMLDTEDPIVFTSSASAQAIVEVRRGSAKKKQKLQNRDSAQAKPAVIHDESDSLPEDLFTAMGPSKDRFKSALSERTANLLASLSVPKAKSVIDGAASRPRFRSTSVLAHDHSSASEAENIAPKSKKPGRKVRQTTEEQEEIRKQKGEEKEAKALARELAKEHKAAEKEVQLAQKKKDKEEAAKEKAKAAAIAEVNKTKVDKKDTTPEMIIDLPISMAEDPLDVSIREFHRRLGVETTTYQHTIPSIIKWRRKVKAEWRSDLGRWEPLPRTKIVEERHLMCWMPAKELAERAMSDNELSLDNHVNQLKASAKDCIPIYLIEGLTEWMRKNKTAENRAYQAQVLGHDTTCEESGQPRARKRAAPVVVDENVVEDALLRLQVEHGCLVHHTDKRETAEWISDFTQNISTVPYRQQQMNLGTTFCMDSGQVKTGEDKADTFVKMLQELVRVTIPIAKGISYEYPDVASLVQGFLEHGPQMLEDVQVGTDYGGSSNRRIGPAISRRLHAVFTSLDPESRDV